MEVRFLVWLSSRRTTPSPTTRGSYVAAGSQRCQVSQPSPLKG